MQQIIAISQIVISFLLVIAILLQNRGTGLSGVFGGSNAVFRTKRGLEKKLSIGTVVLIVIFIGLSIVTLVL